MAKLMIRDLANSRAERLARARQRLEIPDTVGDRDMPPAWEETLTDIDTAEALKESGCEGPGAEWLLGQLAQFGYGMLRSMIWSGEIYRRCADFGRPVKRVSLGMQDAELCHELAHETLIEGVELFKHAVLADQWRPQRGANLRTYFINACILSFPNVYRRVVAREQRWNADPVDATEIHTVMNAEATVANGLSSAAGELDMVTRLLARLEPDMRQVLWYMAEGYTSREIAASLGTTHRSIESRLHRVRAQLRAMERTKVNDRGRHRSA